MGTQTEFDYIIVGAGAAGSVLAYRLSEDPSVSVLVLESGGGDSDPLVSIPKGFYFLYGGKRHSFYYQTRPVGPSGEPETWQRGRLLGGSTSINGMQYQRGGPGYWNSIAAAGNDGWGWSDVLPAFRSLENHELGASETRGAGGPLDITVSRAEDELNDAIFAAAESWGLRRVDDINASDDERVGYIPNTIRNGTRLSAARAFLEPAMRRANLTVLQDAHVGRVLFDGTAATGVRARQSGAIRDFTARREVIVSAGAMESPQLLERSGIGRGDALARAGVKVRVESPHVGEHAVEQRQFAYQASINQRLGYNHLLSSPLRQLFTGAKYLLNRSGVIATGAYDIGAFFKTSEDREEADGFIILNPLSMDLTATSLKVASEPGFSASAYMLHPTTESSVHISGSEPGNPPIIEPHYLEDPAEQDAFLRALTVLRGIADQPALAELIETEQSPGPDVQTKEQAVAHAWASGHILHATGTVRMGPAEDDPVDAALRVRGTENLRVVDAGVIPRQPGNTMAPTLGVAWRAADLIRTGG
ncbi:MAG: GMC family oxidoreductase [Microbacteriaceae bacterium]